MKKHILLLGLLLAIVPVVYAADCNIDVTSKDTKSFLNEIPNLHAEVVACNPDLVEPLDVLFKNDDVELNIEMQDGSIEYVVIVVDGGVVTGITRGEQATAYDITMEECVLDTILSADNTLGAFAYLYREKKAGITGNGIGKRIKLMVSKVFLNIGFKKIQTPVEVSCSDTVYGDQPYNQGEALKSEGELCDHGGQCVTGNCVASNSAPPWTYRCSCDPLRYTTSGCSDERPWEQGDDLKADGQVCDHGGQCSSGKCVGTGQGPPWTYKCSCDPLTFKTSC